MISEQMEVTQEDQNDNLTSVSEIDTIHKQSDDPHQMNHIRNRKKHHMRANTFSRFDPQTAARQITTDWRTQNSATVNNSPTTTIGFAQTITPIRGRQETQKRGISVLNRRNPNVDFNPPTLRNESN